MKIFYNKNKVTPSSKKNNIKPKTKMLIAQYKFDKTIYENYLPSFNDDYIKYSIEDIEENENIVTRKIFSRELPSKIIFGIDLKEDNDYDDEYMTQESNRASALKELDYVKINNLISLKNMFFYCVNLTKVNTSNWDTSKVTNMSFMFYGCHNITSLDISNFDTSNVTTMSSMFFCPKLTTLDVSNFDTSKVTNMSGMFYDCESLTELNVSNFDTSNVTDMGAIFYNCKKITSLELSTFYTGNVTYMKSMFYKCNKLTSLDVSSFDTSNVTNMREMFYTCSKLTSLDLSNFDTSNVTTMEEMFGYCSSLTELVLSNFDTSKVTNMNGMFKYVSNCTIYIGANWTLGTSSTLGDGTNLIFKTYEPITSISLSSTLTDTSNVTENFTIIPTINPNNYSLIDLEIVYDSTYMTINTETNKVSLKDGCQGQTLSITYRSKKDNTISDTITFTVSQDLEIGMGAIDFTQSTAPTLPSCMTLDGQGSSYYFSHGTYTTDVYGLVPNNNGIDSTTAYTRYKFVAPNDGALTFTYRCYAEMYYDYLTVHVDTSTSQPSYDSPTNRVLSTYGATSYQPTDGTASVNVTSGTTYYIHIQYCKDVSGNVGYDMGCIRKIELL